MRIPDYINTAQTNLMRTKTRTFLTVLAFVIGTFTLGMTTAFSQGLRTYINTQISAYGQPDLITVGLQSNQVQTSSSGVPYYQNARHVTSSSDRGKSYSLNQQDLQKVAAVPGVIAAYPQYADAAVDYISYGTAPKYIMEALQAAYPQTSVELAAGHFPTAQQTNGIVLPYPYVEALGAQNASDLIGKTATIAVTSQTTQQQKTFQVLITGILPDTAHVPSPYVAYPTMGAIVQYEQGSTANYNGIAAFMSSTSGKSDRQQVKVALQNDGYTADTYDDLLANYSRPLNIVTYGLDGFAGIALLAATIGIVNTLLMAVLERTQEIGLLKALGMRRRGITFVYLVEAISIGFWGGIVGVLIARILGIVANPILSRTLFKGIGQTHILSYPLPYMAAIVGGAMVIGLLAGTLPAIRAGRLDPIDALRRE